MPARNVSFGFSFDTHADSLIELISVQVTCIQVKVSRRLKLHLQERNPLAQG